MSVILCKAGQILAAGGSTETIKPRTLRRHNAGTCMCDGKAEAPATRELSEGNHQGPNSYTTMSEKPWGRDEWREFIQAKGQDPDKVSFKYGVTSNPNGGFWNKLNDVRPIAVTERDLDAVDLPALYAAAEASTPRPAKISGNRATVIVYADPQIGKTGRRGGTPELLVRSTEIRRKLDQHLASKTLDRILIADAGDGFEGFESGGNPMFTNDLSLPQQMDTYGTELFKFVNIAHKHAPVEVAGVPSNHTAWRNGKQNLGRPGDDLGLLMHKQVQYRTEDRGMDVKWTRPTEYDESVAVDLLGTRIGLVHGNQFGPGQAVTWWEKQTFGAQAATTADILIFGHYHSFSANVAGRNPKTDRQRWCLGAPTLDNGSDWFRTVSGRDSDPGLLVFDVTEDGFDLSSMTIITAGENITIAAA